MRIRYNYVPFIVIFIICILIISLVNNFKETDREASVKIVQIGEIDKSQKDWFIQKSENNQRPTFPDYVRDYIEKYHVHVMGREEKEIYLSFNCGYEYNNYTVDVLDILKSEGVKGAFFVTGGYLRDNPEIIKRMIAEGHIVGNHGNTHADLSKLSYEGIKKEIVDFEASYEEITGVDFDTKYFRPASGVYTEQVLDLANDLGYTTVFWSMAYKDWETDNQPGKDVAYNTMMKYSHDGCILMLHTVSQSNVEALKDVITDLKEKGYEFKSLDALLR